MIVKRIKRTVGSSNYRRLANYILRTPKPGSSEAQQIEWARVTNVGVENPSLAIIAIEATQSLNARTKLDKTYHLVVSFHADDQVVPEALTAIEDELCKSIGLGEHQRMSALHTDTEHAHLHIAINKIHPETLRAIEPHYDYRALSRAAAQLEKAHRLVQVDRNGAVREPLTGAAADVEANAGTQTWQSWLDQTLKPEAESMLAATSSWQELHVALSKFGVGIKPRGAGGVVFNLDGDGRQKASALGKGFGWVALERKLGAYQSADIELDRQPDEPREGPRYQPGPVKPCAAGLWEEYQAARTAALAVRQATNQVAKVAMEEQKRIEKQQAAAARDRIKHSWTLSPAGKRRNYKVLWEQRQRHFKDISAQHRATKQQIYETQPLLTWQDWLLDQAATGNAAALVALRARSKKIYKEKGAFIIAGGMDDPTLVKRFKFKIGRSGQVLYRAGRGRIKDLGDRIHLQSVDRTEDVLATLEIAQIKWKVPLKLTGSDAFCRRIVTLAGAHQLEVRFADAKWEKMRSVAQALKTEIKVTKPQPVKQWIEKRNATWRGGAQMLEHQLAPANKLLRGVYRGTRKVGTAQVVLIEYKNKMLVKPVKVETAERYRKYKIGTSIQINRWGRVNAITDIGR